MEDKKLRKEIDFILPFVDDDGFSGEKKIHVSFISMHIINMYNALMRDVFDIVDIYHRINVTKEEIGSVLVSKVDYDVKDDGSVTAKRLSLGEKRRKYKDLQYKYKDLTDKLKEYDRTSFDKKWELILAILKKNGVADPELLDRRWWESCVDSHYVMAFIEASCTKDDTLVDVKKKQWT